MDTAVLQFVLCHVDDLWLEEHLKLIKVILLISGCHCFRGIHSI